VPEMQTDAGGEEEVDEEDKDVEDVEGLVD
jgi:hypothetical protein